MSNPDLALVLEEIYDAYYADEIEALTHDPDDFSCKEVLRELIDAFDHPDFEHIQDEGGWEGEGDTGVIVFKWKGKFYEYTCHYNSNEGRDYDDSFSTLREVFPVQRMVTFYEGKAS